MAELLPLCPYNFMVELLPHGDSMPPWFQGGSFCPMAELSPHSDSIPPWERVDLRATRMLHLRLLLWASHTTFGGKLAWGMQEAIAY